jgi:large subunit ribosomal protein L29
MATPTKELRELTSEDLDRRAIELQDTLFQDQLKRRTGSLENPSERTDHRRELARILTLLGEKRRAAETGAGK